MARRRMGTSGLPKEQEARLRSIECLLSSQFSADPEAALILAEASPWLASAPDLLCEPAASGQGPCAVASAVVEGRVDFLFYCARIGVDIGSLAERFKPELQWMSNAIDAFEKRGLHKEACSLAEACSALVCASPGGRLIAERGLSDAREFDFGLDARLRSSLERRLLDGASEATKADGEPAPTKRRSI